jgi:hypothetical protein
MNRAERWQQMEEFNHHSGITCHPAKITPPKRCKKVPKPVWFRDF